jgi:hypothetical protein
MDRGVDTFFSLQKKNFKGKKKIDNFFLIFIIWIGPNLLQIQNIANL